jgi:hypothetical protein
MIFAREKDGKTVEAGQKKLLALAQELEEVRDELVRVHATLPVSPREDAMLEGEEEPDEATEMRGVIECALADWIEPAIGKLAAAAKYRRGGR